VNWVQYVFLDRCPLCGSNMLEIWDKPSNIAKCENCSFIFDNPRPSFENISNYYSKPRKYDSWISDISQRDVLWKRRLNKVKRIVSHGNLLDIGAGIGQFLFYAKDYFGTVKGTEISDSAISIAKDMFGIYLLKGRIEEIPQDKSYDVITLFHVLEHVENPHMTIQAIHSLLHPGGVVIIAVPNDIGSLKQRLKRVLKALFPSKIQKFGISGFNRITLDESQGEIHLSHFTPNVLKHFLSENGFDIIEESLDPYFVSRGLRRKIDEIYYFINIVIFRLTGKNLYDTIWIAARKRR